MDKKLKCLIVIEGLCVLKQVMGEFENFLSLSIRSQLSSCSGFELAFGVIGSETSKAQAQSYLLIVFTKFRFKK